MPKKPTWAKPKAPKEVKKLLDKPGQFTTEVYKTKQKAFAKGFKQANWRVFAVGVVIGAALIAIASV